MMAAVNWVMLFLVVFQVKHWLADYPLQNKYMLKKFLPGTAWILPLAAHCGVHAIFTFGICFLLLPWQLSLQLAVFDFAVHFVMDRLKADSKLLGRYKALSGNEFKVLHDAKAIVDNSDQSIRSHMQKTEKYLDILRDFRHNDYFWYTVGFDQAVHHLTHYFIIYQIMRVIHG